MGYNLKNLIESNISEIIADAWDDETSFEDISIKWGLSEKDIKSFDETFSKKRILRCLEKKSK